MSERRFDIIFSGKLTSGADETQVKSNLASLFKIDSKTVESLFSGERVVIKKNVDRATAAQYQQALTRAGALIQLERHGGTAIEQKTDSHRQSDTNTDGQLTHPDRDIGTTFTLLPAGSLLGQIHREDTPIQIDTSHLETVVVKQNPFLKDFDDFISETDADGNVGLKDLAPYPSLQISVDSGGFSLIPPEQLELSPIADDIIQSTISVDIGHLQSNAGYDQILTAEEQARLAEANPELTLDFQFELSEVGGELLKTTEKPSIPSVHIDTNHLQLEADNPEPVE